jgi:uncharacterized protein YprB with RNaseH-like and TPR domain
MSLKDRLTRLTGDTVGSSSNPQDNGISDLRRKLERAMHRREQMIPAPMHTPKRTITPLEHAVIGEEVQTSHGTFFVSRSVMHGDHLHGHSRIYDLSCANMQAVGFLTDHQITQDMFLSNGLFLDSETTGLSGGAGTFPFLIGLGWFESDTFVTCQLFARDFSEEGAMLRYLSDLASGKRFLVTFNGKAYDVNLLAARFILNRCQDKLSPMPHVDLLHSSRRLIAHRLENARLSTIEKHVLGVERAGDLPSDEIPQRYFDWLRQRDGRLLEDVFIHNRIDIVSMASLMKYLSDLFNQNQEMERGRDGDLLKVAGLVYQRGELAKSEKMLRALTSSHDSDIAMGARQDLSVIYKRTNRWDEAVELWQNLVSLDPYNFFAVEELAKFYEHRTGECERALQLVRALLNGKGCSSDLERASAEYRLRRLLHKVSSE